MRMRRMRPIRNDVRKSKKHYHIIFHGRQCGESWAVSSAKAISNWWWKYCKSESEFTYTDIRVEDLDAVEA